MWHSAAHTCAVLLGCPLGCLVSAAARFQAVDPLQSAGTRARWTVTSELSDIGLSLVTFVSGVAVSFAVTVIR